MSDDKAAAEEESVQLKRIRTVTYDELDAYYAEMNTEHPCENCKTAKWSHLCDDTGPVSIKLSSFNRDAMFSVVFVITCEHCGNMRLTNAGAVLGWLAGKDGK